MTNTVGVESRFSCPICGESMITTSIVRDDITVKEKFLAAVVVQRLWTCRSGLENHRDWRRD